MGKEIVYCGGCGKSLREEDFARGRAHEADHRPYCVECRPAPLPAAPTLAKGSSSKHPKISAPQTRRAHAPPASGGPRKGLLAGIGVAAAAAIALGVALASGGGPPPARPTETPSPSPSRPSTSEPARAKAAAPAPAPSRAAPADPLRELEALETGGGDPFAILQRCEELRGALRGTPGEARLRAVEERARARRKAVQVAESLANARRIISSEHALERKDEVLGILRAAREIAGDRRAEVDGLIAEFEKRLRESAARPSEPAPAPAPVPAPAPAPPPATAAAAGTVLVSDNFESGRGRFQGGDLVKDGTQALSVPAAGVHTWKAFSIPVRATTRIRLRLKPLSPVEQVTVMCWSVRDKDNVRYFIRGLKEGEWTAVEFRAAEFRVGWNRSGASLEGGVLDNMKFLPVGEPAADARVLLDDFEVIE